ncbi:iron-containing alcohol dehydrogenase [Virgibacillus salinus]|uniref:Alcohol dehydrogenase, class IV n=1 Tax=Virgibacillus salinus TaxID=553311 RepID=A0A1H1F0K4_9BACI|nr:iron-containing alcohol dehydrogenase [Virgibacillus salinus]SDQ94497.1 Alcohol dehydrogenase, class IV [Virgibacillus salinus]
MDQFISPKKIYHGEGALAKLEDILQELKVERIFILTDPILKSLGVIDPLLKIMDRIDVRVDVVTNVVPEPPLESGNQVVEEARDKQPDLVIGIGGGSALDLAKIAAVLAGNNGRVEDYLNLSGTRKLVNKGLPKVLIPTTSGTGAEVTDIAVFSLENTKDVITHEYLLADYAIVDPALTYTLPPRVTAASGIDALTHAVEAYTSVNSTPLTDSLSLDAMKRIAGNIRTAVWNGKDEHARDQMALGSLLAGLSFYNAGVAGVHALAYPLGGLFKISHGESNAVLLPYVYDHIWMACMDKMKNIAVALSLPIDGKTDREVAQQVVRGFLDLIKDVGLPATIRDYNIKSTDIDVLTENGVQQTRLLARSPKVLDENSIKQIYTNAYEGLLQNS